MTTFRHLVRPIGAVLALSLLVATAFTVNAMTGSSSADAQDSQLARFAIEDQTVVDDGEISLGLHVDPGSFGLSAYTVAVDYDEAVLGFSACEMPLTTGSCNEVDGQVLISGFAVRGFPEAFDHALMQFERIGPADSTSLTVSRHTIANFLGDDLDASVVEFDAGDLFFVDADGALTGDVIDAATGVGLHAIDICISAAGVDEICQSSSGLGTFRFDELISGVYEIVASDSTGVYGTLTTESDVASSGVTTGLVLSLDLAGADDAGTGEAGSNDAGADGTDGPTDGADDAGADDDSNDTGDDASMSQTGQTGRAGQISGVVVNEQGIGLFALEVCATRAVIGDTHCAYSSHQGEFEIPGLDIGNYVLEVSDFAERYSLTDLVTVGVNPGAGVSGLELVVTLGEPG